MSNPPSDPALKRSLDALGKTIREHPRDRLEKPLVAPPADVVQLPLWPETKCGVPNAVLRGALFAAVQGKDRVAMEREFLAVQKGIKIRYTGWQLDQSDLGVWEQALRLARYHPLGMQCHFTARGFLKALGRGGGGRQIESLKSSLSRLTACEVQIRCGPHTYAGSLVEARYENEATGLHMLRLNPDLVKLYRATRWTAVDWEQRRKLRGKPLALWLQGFYASHAEPYSLSIKYLHSISGSRTKQLKHFKQNLAQALKDLEAAGAIKSFEIDADVVHVESLPSGSQQKSLSKLNSHRK